MGWGQCEAGVICGVTATDYLASDYSEMPMVIKNFLPHGAISVLLKIFILMQILKLMLR